MSESSPSRLSVARYLAVTGNDPRWLRPAFVLFFLWIVGNRLFGERPDVATFLFPIICPLAAGTGLLSTARRHHLDLLLGAGVSRFRIWRASLLQGVVVPGILSLIIISVSGEATPRNPMAFLMLRLALVLTFTLGVSFAAGLVELRYLAGVLWLLLRFLFVISPPGLGTLMKYARHVEIPTTTSSFLMALATPESLTEPFMPIGVAFLCAVIGLAAIWHSYWRFAHADFSGGRA
jgi:hypothetical protein